VCWLTVKAWKGLTIEHVKGHQDTVTPAESLSLEAALNIEADALAGQYLRRIPHHITNATCFRMHTLIFTWMGTLVLVIDTP
jgi:hypothetical protein